MLGFNFSYCAVDFSWEMFVSIIAIFMVPTGRFSYFAGKSGRCQSSINLTL